MRHVMTFAALACLSGPPGAFAQEHGAMAGMSMGGKGGAAGASSRAYEDAMMKMHKGMDITYSGNADRDFAAGMLPHHQGAVDMARIELRYGKDPELRRLAQAIVQSQEKEIAFMKAWRAKHTR